MLMALANTTSVNDSDIIDKLAHYRMAWIKSYWLKNQRVLEEWYQYVDDYASNPWTIFTLPAVPPSVTPTVITGGLATTKRTIKLPNYIHLRINSIVEIGETGNEGNIIYPMEYQQLMMMIELSDNRLTKFNFYAERAQTIYTYPIKNFRLRAILEEPSNGQTLNVSTIVNHGQLVQGQSYIVESGGTITYPTILGQDVTFQIGMVFVATSINDWVDNDPLNPAVIKIYGVKPSYSHKYFDEYPIDSEGAQQVILEILTKDYAIRLKAISDVIEDGQDQFKVLTTRQ
jgi:hypothetical protein